MIDIKKIIDKYDSISFDVFDTLINRTVEKPSDVFYKSALLYTKNHRKAEEFRNARIKAEKLARDYYKDKEIDIEDIYEFIDGDLFDNDLYKNNEIEFEIDNCVANSKMKKVFDYAISKNKQVFIVSDMYLPKSVIKEMLQKCHICGYTELYVSNDSNCNKLSGKLFKCVLHDYGLNSTEIVHFGDSIKADILGAKKAGICARAVNFSRTIKRVLSK